MPVAVNSRAAALVSAAFSKWPDIYPNSIKEPLMNKIDKYSPDPKEQVYAARHYLMEWAARQCGSCTECSLANNRCCGPVWADGNVNAPIVVIGEGPGQYEQRTCIPFTHSKELEKSWCQLRCANFPACFPVECMKTGKRLPECAKSRTPVDDDTFKARAGRKFPPIATAAGLLDSAIDGVFTRESWNGGRSELGQELVASGLYITNIVKCRSINKDGDDTPPNMSYATACHKWLDLQLTIIQPKVVILLGKPAGADLLGLPRDSYKMTQFNGVFAKRPAGKFPKLPKSVQYIGTAFHPSYIKRQYDINEAAGDEAFAGIRNVFTEAAKVIYGGTAKHGNTNQT